MSYFGLLEKNAVKYTLIILFKVVRIAQSKHIYIVNRRRNIMFQILVVEDDASLRRLMSAA